MRTFGAGLRSLLCWGSTLRLTPLSVRRSSAEFRLHSCLRGAHQPILRGGTGQHCYSSHRMHGSVALKRSWLHIFRWKTGQRAENSKWPAWEMTTAAHDSRAVGTAWHQSHRTIDPQCLTKSPPRRGGIFALTKNVASPVHAEPAQTRLRGGSYDPEGARSMGGRRQPSSPDSVHRQLSRSP